jgi:hypothetical protein
LQVAQSFLTALQNDERANYQVDVKFQESYLKKVVDLLHCQLTEGAAMKSENNDVEMHNAENHKPSDLEEGELPDSHGIFFLMIFHYFFIVSLASALFIPFIVIVLGDVSVHF